MSDFSDRYFRSGIMLEMQTILQKNLQTVDVVSGYW